MFYNISVMKKSIRILLLSLGIFLGTCALGVPFFGVQAAEPYISTQPVLDGALIKTLASNDVYIVKIYGGKRFKRLILNPQIFNQYQHLKWENIQVVTQQSADSFIVLNLVRAVGDPNVYKLYPNGDIGTKRRIKDPQQFSTLNCDWDAVYTINSFERDSYVLDSAGSLDQCVGMTGSTSTSGGSTGGSTGGTNTGLPGNGTVISDATFFGEYWNLPTGSKGSPAFPASAPNATRNDNGINFNWGLDAPMQGINADHFAVRWTRVFTLPVGAYTLSFTGDDGFRVYVDNVLILDKWGDQAATTYSADYASSGGSHQVKVEYYENSQHAVAKLVIVQK